MFAYHLKIALASLRRRPLLSTLLVAAIALGIMVTTTSLTGYTVLTGNPIPTKSDVLHYVQVDAWEPDDPYDDDRPDEPPPELTYRDMMAAMQSDVPTYKSGMFKGSLTVHPEGEDARPFRALSRQCFADFFPMFEVPFRYGGPWDAAADENAEPVVVLDRATNERLFGDVDSVGRRLRIEQDTLTIVGVLENWDPMPKFYDVTNGSYDESEELFLPLNYGIREEFETAGNTSGWKPENIDSYQDRLDSELTWVQMWVQLDTPAQHAEYVAYLDAYTDEQRELGRHGRPNNNRVRPVMAWLEADEAIPDDPKTMLIISLLFLVVCSFNLIGILLGKFLAQAPEIGVRRALGASRASIFMQHIVECELIGVTGGVIGVLLSLGAIRAVKGWVNMRQVPMELDAGMLLAALALSLGAGLLAGIYPAWRVCRIAPAHHLKAQ